MHESNIVLIDLPQADGGSKVRPALILKRLPKYQDFLVCGISTQIHQFIEDYDVIINDDDRYFDKTGLHKTSIIRLFFLAVVSAENISGSIGNIPHSLHKKLLDRLAMFLTS